MSSRPERKRGQSDRPPAGKGARRGGEPPNAGSSRELRANDSCLEHELEAHQAELRRLQNEELRSERAELEGALSRATELFDFAPVAYFVIGREGDIRNANHAAARLLGSERRDLVGNYFESFVYGQARAEFSAMLARVLTRSPDKSEEWEAVLYGARPLLIDAKLTVAILRGAEPTVLVVAEDVSERRRAERAMLDENRKKDDFLAMLSHELRNPLATICNALRVTERVPAGSPQAVHAGQIVGRQVQHLSRIVDDLLDLTRVAHGKVRLQLERSALDALVERAADDYRASFEAAGVQLRTTLAREPMWADADRTRIAQVLGNLLGNALKFTPRGGQVEIRLAREGDRNVVSVVDNGTGIEPAVLDSLFEPFRQAPQALERKQGGLGLGLAMVKGLVELHGGFVEIHSEGRGRGTEVRFGLPAKTPPEREQGPARKPARPRRRVLVIEDNVESAEMLKEVLSLTGQDVVVAHDGASGLSLARDLHPDVVVCDLGLPEMDGYQVAKALREDESLKGTRLVALSGYALPQDLQRAREAGFDRHVAKPATFEQIESLFS
jgi:PAS domain S-box-containing protein